MQKNCHEFIAYENLTSSRGRTTERGKPGSAAIAQALPLVKRALKVLSEREVTPQLGLLKSTLLQLDSTFSERDYGASSFRDFMEKVAQSGAVTLKHAGRSMLVESRESGATEVEAVAERAPQAAPPAPAPIAAAPAAGGDEPDEEETLSPSPMSMQDGIRAVQHAFTQTATPPRWPMYVRQAKQFLRNSIEGFDERKYGFASVVDLLRAAGKEGFLRIERDRQGAVRVFPGNNLAPKTAPVEPQLDAEAGAEPDIAFERMTETTVLIDVARVEEAAEAPILEAEPLDTPPAGADGLEADEDTGEDDVDGNRVTPASRSGARKRRAPAVRAPRAAAGTKPRAARPRARKSTRS
jgi:hypothetical protein